MKHGDIPTPRLTLVMPRDVDPPLLSCSITWLSDDGCDTYRGKGKGTGVGYGLRM
jgi:hypothetical protein